MKLHPYVSEKNSGFFPQTHGMVFEMGTGRPCLHLPHTGLTPWPSPRRATRCGLVWPLVPWDLSLFHRAGKQVPCLFQCDPRPNDMLTANQGGALSKHADTVLGSPESGLEDGILTMSIFPS